ncbi:UDP-2,3-diacylglucosamine pyrophosphatase LpxH [Lutibacter oceani]|uniref:UDP-2,3-diacylglucosamine pyrophosphatase LpxH n=1 Tax=Lutibacter oceani TaxID=1853311 RepID=A0A3D9S3E6_9FLAO|nr:metallophosphoesterase [Lutibacter oceani]REE83375.1 UDP-2,3-diacylglucosamine pyrophosphatase LpxH [Lutibacter oceani]
MIQQIISKSYKNAKKIPLNKDSKFIFFSDCHRGDNSYADDFANNSNIYYHALRNYYEKDFTYIELGDGIELWENLFFNEIFEAHKNDFLLMRKFHLKKRLHMIWGNHDMSLKSEKKSTKLLDSYFDKITGTNKDLLKGLTFNEGIILEPEGFDKNILLIHGHQADFYNYVWWKWSRFLVRILWKPLQIIGIKDPTSPAKNFKELIKVERRLKKWILANNNQMVIAGHTHRPRFPEPNELPYFNDGSCVHPRSITGIEIVDLKISLIKWHIISKKDGTLQIVKSVLEEPREIALYLK